MSRPAPSDQPPPYAAVRFVNIRQSLRPTVLITCFFGFIWSIVAGVYYIRARTDAYNPSQLKTIQLVEAILWFVAAAIELFGFGAAWTQRLALVRSYFVAGVVAAFCVVGACILRFIFHFIDKTVIQSSCVAEEIADNDLSTADATSYCSGLWSNGTWWDIAFVIITALVSFFFVSIIASFRHQLLNPSTLRQHTTSLAPSSAYSYPLAPYSGPPPNTFAPPPGAPPGYNPSPYGGPPQYEGEDDYGQGKEKDPFADGMTPTTGEASGGGFSARQGEGNESTDTVTLEPRRENERRV